MDVLELPRPVINFLRTMAKESCRYALSWDIFGGPDSVTLTLTWKLIDDEAQSSMINETMSSPPSSSSSLKQQQQQQQNYDNPRTRSTIKDSNRPSSPRRSRRDENTSINENISVPAIFRSSRGKSLEGSSLQSNKQIISHHQHNVKEQQQQQQPQQHISSLERQTITNHHHHQHQHQHQHQHRTKKEQQQKQIPIQSDQIYGNLYDTRSTPVVKCATISSLSSSSPSPQPNNINNNNNPPLSFAHTHHQRAKQQPVTSPTTRKPIRSLMNTSRTPTIPITSNISSNYTKSRGNNNITTHDDNNNNNNNDDDDTLDPWVKRFECSFEDNDDETTEQSEEKEPTSTTTDNIDELGNTSGKVKFKTKPDYF